MQWKLDNLCGFLVVHLLAVLAFIPWFFSWTGVILLFAGLYFVGVLGINLGYHRILTHRSVAFPLWLERVMVTLAACNMQDSPPRWVAVHRRHHQFTDGERDPHSPVISFFWAHMGWMLVKLDDMPRGPLIDRYAKDIMRDPYYAWLERHSNWINVALLSWLVFFTVGFGAVALSGGSLMEATQFGASLVVWGAVVRTVVVWHTTWSVNSVTHYWGYRNYNTPDISRNNLLIAVLTFGEGWHNNHHADPAAARHGHQWWEFDPTWLTIRLLMRLGLAKDVALPSPVLASRFKTSSPQLAPAGADRLGVEINVPLAPGLEAATASKPAASERS